jgi:hypothetical protein
MYPYRIREKMAWASAAETQLDAFEDEFRPAGNKSGDRAGRKGSRLVRKKTAPKVGPKYSTEPLLQQKIKS